jgi:hypothetical protein
VFKKDGTRVHAYMWCTHNECGNIAKKLVWCFRHGAPCSGKVCKADKGMLALLVSRGDMDMDANEVNYKRLYLYMEAFVKEFMSDVKVEDKN